MPFLRVGSMRHSKGIQRAGITTTMIVAAALLVEEEIIFLGLENWSDYSSIKLPAVLLSCNRATELRHKVYITDRHFSKSQSIIKVVLNSVEE